MSPEVIFLYSQQPALVSVLGQMNPTQTVLPSMLGLSVDGLPPNS